MSDLVERLRSFDAAMAMYKVGNAEWALRMCREAADRIEGLEREVATLRLYGNDDCTAQADEVLARMEQGNE